MSHKLRVIELHNAGKDYNEIEKETGAKRTYIRTIISQYKKTPDAGMLEEKTNEDNNEAEEMRFENDIEGKDNMVGDKMADPKTGKEYHEAWIKEKSYECACGCVLNRKSTFCPNCGTTLDWSGF